MNDRNETTEMWREVRKDQQERRAERLPKRTDEIEQLRSFGYTVERLTDYQFRVSNWCGRVDLYPTHRRYHNLATNKRGDYRDVLKCIGTQLG